MLYPHHIIKNKKENLKPIYTVHCFILLYIASYIIAYIFGINKKGQFHSAAHYFFISVENFFLLKCKKFFFKWFNVLQTKKHGFSISMQHPTQFFIIIISFVLEFFFLVWLRIFFLIFFFLFYVIFYIHCKLFFFFYSKLKFCKFLFSVFLFSVGFSRKSLSLYGILWKNNNILMQCALLYRIFLFIMCSICSMPTWFYYWLIEKAF